MMHVQRTQGSVQPCLSRMVLVLPIRDAAAVRAGNATKDGSQPMAPAACSTKTRMGCGKASTGNGRNGSGGVMGRLGLAAAPDGAADRNPNHSRASRITSSAGLVSIPASDGQPPTFAPALSFSAVSRTTWRSRQRPGCWPRCTRP